MSLRPFHLAFPVKNLHTTQQFYETILGCKLGRRTDTWIDFDFFGHQLTAHLKPEDCQPAEDNTVDGYAVPVRHCGVILTLPQWQSLATRLQQQQISFIIKPYIRFQGQPGEQATMFFLDPSGNALEFKAFADDRSIFATD